MIICEVEEVPNRLIALHTLCQGGTVYTVKEGAFATLSAIDELVE